MTTAELTTAEPPAAARRWPLSRIVGVAVLALLLFSVAAVVAGGIALVRHARCPQPGR